MYVDMHMHQLDYSSDGHQTVSQIIQATKAAGLMGFCITDHYDKEIAYRPDREEIFRLTVILRPSNLCAGPAGSISLSC